jgi:putative toxin-antitoxin system antitoxin component (TIGR02293 family)
MAKVLGAAAAKRSRRDSIGRTPASKGTAKDQAQSPVIALDNCRRQFGHEAILAGVDARLLKAAVGRGVLRLDELQRLIPASTLARKVREGRKLTREEADQVARLLRIKAYAAEVLEDPAVAETWLLEPNPALGNRVPAELLVTDEGTRAVETVLRRIDYGDYS